MTRKRIFDAVVARPLSEWHEDIGDVLWWKFPIEEAPWVGTPLTLGHTVELHTRDGLGPRMAARCDIGGWPGYHTHWTPLPPRPIEPTDSCTLNEVDSNSFVEAVLEPPEPTEALKAAYQAYIRSK